MGEKAWTHMETGVTDTDRLGKRSDNWAPGLTRQRSSFVSAKDQHGEGLRAYGDAEWSLAGEGKGGGAKGSFVKVEVAAAGFLRDEKDPTLL